MTKKKAQPVCANCAHYKEHGGWHPPHHNMYCEALEQFAHGGASDDTGLWTDFCPPDDFSCKYHEPVEGSR